MCAHCERKSEREEKGGKKGQAGAVLPDTMGYPSTLGFF